jgi:hypothetical protein
MLSKTELIEAYQRTVKQLKANIDAFIQYFVLPLVAVILVSSLIPCAGVLRSLDPES